MPEKNFFTVDIHTHIMPEKMPRFAQKFGYDGFIHLEHHHNCRAKMMIGDKFFREIESNCWDPKQRIVECEQSNVDMQVLSTIPVLFNYWAKPQDTYEVSRFLNDHLAEIVHNHPGRFFGLGTLPMQDSKLTVKELQRCVEELNLQGVQIGSHINEMNLEDPALYPFWEAAESLDAAVFIHPWDMVGKEKMPKYWLPWLVGMPAETSLAICSMIFGGIFEKFPKLRVAFAHGGGSFPATIGRIERGFNVRPDLCAVDNPVNPRNYIGKFFIDSLVHDPKMLEYIVDLMGAEKICLGSDYPFPLGEEVPGKLVKESQLSANEKQHILALSAFDWLGVDKNCYIN